MPRPKKGEEHPHEHLRSTISMHAAIGTPTEMIARIIGISKATLHKHYQDDLDLGSHKANAVVGGKIFEAAKKGEQWACSLWAARRMGWVDASKRQVELTGKDGGPIQQEVTTKDREEALDFINEYASLKSGSSVANVVAKGGTA